jgi:3-hydroxyacyl-CoA dehydrogenase
MTPRPEVSPVKRVAVVGAGTIGASWATLFLAKGYRVQVSDPDPARQSYLQDYVTAAVARMEADDAGSEAFHRDPLQRLAFRTQLEAAVEGADFVQESAPERIELKRELLARIDAALPADRVIASSSSGLSVSAMQADMAHPERLVLGHPFNPPHIVPLVEVVGGARTAPEAIAWAIDFYRSCGKHPLALKKEVPGHIANRLQAAVWREAIHLVLEGVASVAEVDEAMRFGPGLRWALMGPHLTFHLGGGAGGMAHFIDHIGPAMQAWWDDLGSPELTEETKQILIAGARAELGDRSADDLLRDRDRLLSRIVALVQDSPVL